MARARRSAHKLKNPVEATRRRLVIDYLAHRGDGVANHAGKTVYIPHTLPGEEVDADIIAERGLLHAVISPSSERITAPCALFGTCGGCALQHMNDDYYRNWKQAQVAKALSQYQIETEITGLVSIPAHTRRRATFAIQRHSGKIVFGFHGARSQKVVPLENCLVLVRQIENALGALKALADLVPIRRETMKMHVFASETGLDIRLDDFGDWPDFAVERALMDEVIKAGFARLSLGDTVLIEAKKPLITFDNVRVTPPPGGFMQATFPSEQVMAKLVTEALSGHGLVADLFSGSGTFALRLAKNARVHAVESEAASLLALEKAARAAAHDLKPVTVEKRDLFFRPLMAKELNRFSALVLDPPRAGAAQQISEIGKSDITKVAYVSCAPASFSRDAHVLIEAGFKLVRVTPVDQFLHTHHIELVGTFEREG